MLLFFYCGTDGAHFREINIPVFKNWPDVCGRLLWAFMRNILIWNNYRHSVYDRAFLVVRQILKEFSSILA